MQILVTPTFQRTVKKLRAAQKADLDEAVRQIVDAPSIGDMKVGDLAGVQVHRFRLGNLLTIVAYRVLDESRLKLLMVGPHENFYRALKGLDS